MNVERGYTDMIKTKIIKHDEHSEVTPELILELSKLYTFDEPENFENLKKFFNDWFKDHIPGKKVTGLLYEEDELMAATRIWETPYLNNTWLVEGLETRSDKRRLGYGKMVLSKSISSYKSNEIKSIESNISQSNIGSIALHKSLGFTLKTIGSLNSYGEFREHTNRYELKL
jgi:ribosomal protein S18 acetylase RimI-like enzyme